MQRGARKWLTVTQHFHNHNSDFLDSSLALLLWLRAVYLAVDHLQRLLSCQQWEANEFSENRNRSDANNDEKTSGRISSKGTTLQQFTFIHRRRLFIFQPPTSWLGQFCLHLYISFLSLSKYVVSLLKLSKQNSVGHGDLFKSLFVSLVRNFYSRLELFQGDSSQGQPYNLWHFKQWRHSRPS